LSGRVHRRQVATRWQWTHLFPKKEIQPQSVSRRGFASKSSVEAIVESIVKRMQHDGNGVTFSKKGKQQQSVSGRGFALKKKKRRHSIIECRVELIVESTAFDHQVDSIIDWSEHDGNGLTFFKPKTKTEIDKGIALLKCNGSC